METLTPKPPADELLPPSPIIAPAPPETSSIVRKLGAVVHPNASGSGDEPGPQLPPPAWVGAEPPAYNLEAPSVSRSVAHVAGPPDKENQPPQPPAADQPARQETTVTETPEAPAPAGGGGGDEPPDEPRLGAGDMPEDPHDPSGEDQTAETPSAPQITDEEYLQQAREAVANAGTVPLESVEAREARIAHIAKLLKALDNAPKPPVSEPSGTPTPLHPTDRPAPQQPEDAGTEGGTLHFLPLREGAEAADDDAAVPAQELPEPPTPETIKWWQKTSPVMRYLARPIVERTIEEGASIDIPVGPRTSVTFTNRDEAWFTGRDVAIYREDLFADTGTDVAPESANIAGGETAALAPFKRVLDIGSGEAIALLQYAQIYPHTSFIGVDVNYGPTPPVSLDRPGPQLSADDWHTLRTIPDSSIDTVLSCNSNVQWGITHDDARARDVVDAVTRVTRTGGTWRFNMPPDLPQKRAFVEHLLRERGWVMQQAVGKNRQLLPTVVARKIGTMPRNRNHP